MDKRNLTKLLNLTCNLANLSTFDLPADIKADLQKALLERVATVASLAAIAPAQRKAELARQWAKQAAQFNETAHYACDVGY